MFVEHCFNQCFMKSIGNRTLGGNSKQAQQAQPGSARLSPGVLHPWSHRPSIATSDRSLCPPLPANDTHIKNLHGGKLIPSFPGECRQDAALYVVAGLDKLACGVLRFNQDQQPSVICEIKEALSEKMRWDDTKRFELYKVDFTPQESLALRSNNLPSMDPTAKLHDFDRVAQLWPRGFPRTRTAFVADMMPDTPPPGSDHERSSVQVKIYEEAQSLVMSSFSNLTPSKLAKAIPFMKHQATENAIYNGRPQNRTGPPIGLYFSIFDSFVAGLEDSTRDIPPKKLEAALSLLERSQEQYKTELSSSGRTAALVPGLNKLLGTKLFNREVAGAKPDGSISAANGAPCLVVEMKNEVGMGGCDPCIQGAISYVKSWSDPNQDDIRPASCCPSFILAIAGPYMCVLGAIMLDHPVVQLLTPFFWVGDHVNPAFHSDICALARLFISLSDSVKELKKFYNSLESDDRNPARFYPYIRQFKLQGHSTNFQYVEALFPNKLVFEACMGVGTNKRMLIVKFAESYNAKAHRLLAEKRLAPELLF
ncbi:hypothetical protein BDV93DRAFT_549651, partial [Ceratobasidium sp. AG-I]